MSFFDELKRRNVVRVGLAYGIAGWVLLQVADLVLVDPNRPNTVRRKDLLYKCGWSPLEGYEFQSSVRATFVNGAIAWIDGQLTGAVGGRRLAFA